MAKGRTRAGIRTEIPIKDAYLGQINVHRFAGAHSEPEHHLSPKPLWPDQRGSIDSHRSPTYKFYVFEDHCELIRKTDPDQFQNPRIALWPPGTHVPDRDEDNEPLGHEKRYWLEQERFSIQSAELIELNRGTFHRAVRQKLLYGDRIDQLRELQEPYLKIKCYRKSLKRTFQVNMVLLYDFVLEDWSRFVAEEDLAYLEDVRFALLGRR